MLKFISALEVLLFFFFRPVKVDLLLLKLEKNLKRVNINYNKKKKNSLFQVFLIPQILNDKMCIRYIITDSIFFYACEIKHLCWLYVFISEYGLMSF